MDNRPHLGRPTKCRHCGQTWRVPTGTDTSKHYCNACSRDRQAIATARFGRRTYKHSTDGRWLVSQKEPPMDTRSPGPAPLPLVVRALFTAPFSRVSTDLVEDANGELAVEYVKRCGPLPRVSLRRTKKERAEWCAWFCANVPESAKLDEAVVILNNAWEAEP